MSKFCVTCGAPNDEQATNCSACSAAFPETVQVQPEAQQPVQQPVQQTDYQQYYQQYQQPEPQQYYQQPAYQQPEPQQYYQQPAYQQPVQQADYQQYYQQPAAPYYPPAQPIKQKTKLSLASIINIPAAIFQLLTVIYWLFPVIRCRVYYYSYYSYTTRSYNTTYNIFEFCDKANTEEMAFLTIIIFALNIAALALNVISVIKPKLGNTLLQIPQIAVTAISYIGYLIVFLVAEGSVGYYDCYCNNDGGLILLAVISLVAIALQVVTLVLRLKDKKEEKNQAMQMSMQMNTPYYG